MIEKKYRLWEEACQIFHEQKDELIFPGGRDRIYLDPHYWDFETTETALCFLEIRSYHFNSGYIRTHLLRHLKKSYLTEKQKIRFTIVMERQLKWKALKASRNFGYNT